MIPGLGKEVAPHSSTLAWKIPWMEEPGRLQSMGSQSQTLLSDFTFFLSIVPFGEGKDSTPVFLPAESHGQRGLVGYSLWGCRESDTTEQITHTHTQGTNVPQATR